MRLVLSATLLLGTSLIGACDGGRPPPPRAEPQGREETRNIRNTESIGYAGNAIADRIDATLDASAAQQQRLKEAAAVED